MAVGTDGRERNQSRRTRQDQERQRKTFSYKVWRGMPLLPALAKQRQEDLDESEASLTYIVSPRSPRSH